MGISASSVIWHVSSMFVASRTGRVQHIFPKSFYDYLPDHGNHAVVATPHQNKRTYFPVQPKYIERFNGFKGKHYCGSEAFKVLWQQRRRGSFWNVDIQTGISDYQYEKIYEQKGRFYGRGVVSSREPQTKHVKPQFYATVQKVAEVTQAY